MYDQTKSNFVVHLFSSVHHNLFTKSLDLISYQHMVFLCWIIGYHKNWPKTTF